MNVPPFVPPPIEIPQNVAQEPYRERLKFLRRVVALFVLSLLIVCGASVLPFNVGPFDIGFMVGSLILLSITRGIAKGRTFEQQVSLVASIALFASLGMVVRRAETNGWPVWMIGVGCICLVAYTVLCGKDFSFTGMWMLSLLVSTSINLILGALLRIGAIPLYLMLSLNVAYLSYWVYDLAALQTRRRKGEEIGAVLDLYRDVLNLLSYPIRVWDHWRTHKIWSAR